MQCTVDVNPHSYPSRSNELEPWSTTLEVQDVETTTSRSSLVLVILNVLVLDLVILSVLVLVLDLVILSVLVLVLVILSVQYNQGP